MAANTWGVEMGIFWVTDRDGRAALAVPRRGGGIVRGRKVGDGRGIAREGQGRSGWGGWVPFEVIDGWKKVNFEIRFVRANGLS